MFFLLKPWLVRCVVPTQTQWSQPQQLTRVQIHVVMWQWFLFVECNMCVVLSAQKPPPRAHLHASCVAAIGAGARVAEKQQKAMMTTISTKWHTN